MTYTKIYDITNKNLFTYDSDKITHDGTNFLLKDRRPANASYFANYNTNKDANWADGSRTGTLNGGATVSGGLLNTSGFDGKYASYSALDNADHAQVLCVAIEFSVSYLGSPANNNFIFSINKGDGSLNNVVQVVHLNTGIILFQVYNNAGVVIFNANLAAWVATAGLHNLEINMDITSGESRLFIDGVQLGATQVATGVRDSANINSLYLGTSQDGTGLNGNQYNNVLIFDAIQHTANYTPDWSDIPNTIYYTDNPYIEVVSNLQISELLTFVATITKSGSDEIKFINELNNTDKYFSGSWKDSNGSYSQSNIASIINTNSESFISCCLENYKWKAFLHSENGLTTPILSGLTITYEASLLYVGVNSWVTVEEANYCLLRHFGAGSWASLSSEIKEQCLITAFWWIYNYPDVNIPKNSTNEKVKKAQIDLAWWIYNYYEEYRQRESLIASGVKSFHLSRWSETLNGQDLPQSIKDILSDVLENTGGVFPTFTREIEN